MGQALRALAFADILTQTLRSELEDIPGVGTGRRTQLLRHFGSLKQIRDASLLELQSVPGLPERVAQAVYDHFHAASAVSQ